MTAKSVRQLRKEAIVRLRELATKMLIGSLSETYRTCGQPTCRCHTTGPRHGPHLYVSYKVDGKSTGYYVPEPLHHQVREGVAAWKEHQALSKEIAQLNRELMKEELAQAKAKAKQ